MVYNTEQKEKIRENIQKIVDYIEVNILPHITYSYETGAFGPIETWGRFDENTGCRYHIALNGPYKEKIRFYHAGFPYNVNELVESGIDNAVVFLEYWQDAKSYMNTEIKNNAEKIKIIETFEI